MNKFLEAALDEAEVIADNLTSNEVVKSIPVVGTALKLVQGTKDLRDKIFIAKIERFITEIETFSSTKRIKFLDEVLKDKESLRTTGETALLVLDKLDDLKKAELVGFYFSCFLCGLLDQAQFRRVAVAIGIAFVDDVEFFLKHGLDDLLSQKQFMEALSPSGITTLSAGKTYNDAGELFYEASSMGRQMFEIWQQYGKR